MNQPSPAIVQQEAVRPLPRWVLWVLCGAYVLAGFMGRSPWKGEDIESFGHMLALAHPAPGQVAQWLHPAWMGQPDPQGALLPYWLGAWVVSLLPGDGAFAAVRLPFMGLLALTLWTLWHAAHALARHPGAAPVSFAFGGEARPRDYARTLADGSVLALLATLGLARAGHETTPAVVQLCAQSLLLYGLAALPVQRWTSLLALCTGLLGLTLSGAPSVALAMGLWGLLVRAWPGGWPPTQRVRMLDLGLLALTLLTCMVLAGSLQLWQWRITGLESQRLLADLRLLAWFTWPCGPLALWALWRWRHQLRQLWQHPHLSLPLGFMLITVSGALLTAQGERALILALPSLATLTALALPTLSRSLGALIDWFTLVFFSLCGTVIWVVWLAMQTGWPASTAANVTRTAPGFVPGFSWLLLMPALAVTLGWLVLVRWRTGRQRSALWKSLILPAGGAVLCWSLLTSLWLPLLDYSRSYGPLVDKVRALTGPVDCVQIQGLNLAQGTALRYHAGWQLQAAGEPSAHCAWLIRDHQSGLDEAWAARWDKVATLRRPSDKREDWILYRARGPQP